MKIKSILLILITLVFLNGCRTGPATYEVWEKGRNTSIQKKLNYTFKDEDRKVYDKNHYIYIFEYPKHCVCGYLINKKDKNRIILDWVIISGKEFCKVRQATTLIQ